MSELRVVQREIVTDGETHRVFKLADPLAEVDANSWSPLLKEVLAAGTIRSQRNAVLRAVLRIGSTYGGLQAKGAGHPFYDHAIADTSLKANIGLDPAGNIRLRSIATRLGESSMGEIGYFNLSSKARGDSQRGQAFAVVDVRGPEYSHDIYRTGDQELNDAAKGISVGVVRALAWHIHEHKPEFGALTVVENLDALTVAN